MRSIVVSLWDRAHNVAVVSTMDRDFVERLKAREARRLSDSSG